MFDLKDSPTKIFLVAVLPAILTVFIIFFVIMPKVREGRVDNTPVETSQDIIWSRAIEILNSGQVKQVFQAHSLEVRLKLKDGTTFKTQEPSIDDIFDEVQKCGNPCRDIILATE